MFPLPRRECSVFLFTRRASTAMAADCELIRTLATLAEPRASVQLRASQTGFASVTAIPNLTASIPTFSGSSSAAGAMREIARSGVSHVNMVAAQAGWNDEMTFAVPSSKLSGTALKWHRATGKRLETWSKWGELQKVFLDDESNPRALCERMVRRTLRPRETVVDYFFRQELPFFEVRRRGNEFTKARS